MKVHSHFKDYDVNIVENLNFLDELIVADNSEFVVDSNVYRVYKRHFDGIAANRLIIVDATEKNKVIDSALNICENMTEISAKRNACLVSVGGGIIQDISGFAANILYRGIKWIYVPTTLLAGCDSCIGGKTSLNYKGFKNLLGTFYSPDEIYVCPAFFQTLTQKDFESGLGEVIKFNIMAGQDGLKSIEEKIKLLLERNESSLRECVANSLIFKKEFIEIDEFDRGERVKLNFAHTFGHGIETVSQYIIPHGTAVAIGMIMANHISEKRNILSHDIVNRSEKVLLKVIHIDYDLRSMNFDNFINAIKKDKKQVDNQLTAVLMTDTPKDLRIVRDVRLDEIKDAVDYLCELLYKG